MNYVNARAFRVTAKSARAWKRDNQNGYLYTESGVGERDVLLHRKNYVMFTGRFILAVSFERLRNAVSLLTIELPCQLP